MSNQNKGIPITYNHVMFTTYTNGSHKFERSITSFLDSLPFWRWSFHASTVWTLMTCPSSDEPAILSGISFFSYYKFLYQRKECILLCSHNCYSVTALNTENGLGILVNKKGLPLSFFYEFAINHDKMHANAKKINCPINDYLLLFFWLKIIYFY